MKVLAKEARVLSGAVFLAVVSGWGSGCTAGPGTADESATGGASTASDGPMISEGSGGEGTATGGASGVPSGGTTGDIVVDPNQLTGDGGSGMGGATVNIVSTLPPDFFPADVENPEMSRGGYRVLGPLSDVPPAEGECANILRVLIRDFETSHDDFEHANDWSRFEVESPIGEARKPVKTSDNGPLHFEEWYQNVEGVNQPFAVDLWLEPVGDTFVFDSSAFFPLNEWGFQDTYLFTTELHTRFEYKGGEVFTFRGDDDVFVYVNGHLAVNLSGIHNPETGSVSLDEVAAEFGLVPGGTYAFELFQAERQPSGSNFRMETTLDFTGCGEILPTDIVVR